MRYGIITYTSAQNWGAILQAYALYHYLRKLDIDCQLINYRAFDSRRFKPRKEIKDMIFSFLRFKENKERIARYTAFRKENLDLSDKVLATPKEMKSLNREYDAFITGSDQLWNCETEICYDFYLNFADPEKILLSYAPSFGQESIPPRFENEVAKLLKRYDMKSVREISGKKIVKRLIGEDIPIVCDPTFLLTKEEWKELANTNIKEKNYIFVYTTQVSKKVVKLVKAYKALHPHIRIISPYALPGINAEIYKNIGPAEFLTYIKNSDYVIGTSFHSVVFSLIFRKNFCVVPHSSTGARVYDLLSRLGLEKHVITNINPSEFPILDIDYGPELQRYIQESKDYIDSMISYRKNT